MITLTVDPKVLKALRQAFPKPANSAKRALDKYVVALTELLKHSLSRGVTPTEAKLNAFNLSLHELANKGGQIGKKKVRVHAWLRNHDLALVEPITLGSNWTGMVSLVKFTDLVTLNWHAPEATTESTWVDGMYISNTLLESTDNLNKEIFEFLYPDYGVCIADHRFEEVFDVLNIDVDSLKNYTDWLQTEAVYYTKQKRDHYLFQARLILAVAQYTGGQYFQRKIHSDFGRTYYAGTSVQNVPKKLRYAMLGNCWEYDIRSSVVAWKMGFAKSYVANHHGHSSVAKEFSMTLMYLQNKPSLMKNVQTSVFGKDCDLSEELQQKMLKQAFTAISFGARLISKGWVNKNGDWENPSIADIFKRADERDRFLTDMHVTEFAKEQDVLDTYLYDNFVVHCPDLLLLPYLQTHKGRPSKSKIIAYMYQHEETAVMDVVRQKLSAAGKEVIANIHDAIIIKHHLTGDAKHDIELEMQEQTSNPYWRLGSKEIKRWGSNLKEIKMEEAEHRQRLLAADAAALNLSNGRDKMLEIELETEMSF